MNRRALITLLGGAAAWPLVARGKHAERMRLRSLPHSERADALFVGGEAFFERSVCR
jgi:hypothetical protein